MAGSTDEARHRAATRILAIARELAIRSRQAQISLIHEFEDSVREHAAVLGRLPIEAQADEELALGRDGRFEGRLLVEDGGSSSWQVIGGAADVVDHYDLVDLFADLSDALADEFPDLEADASGEPDPADTPPTVERPPADGGPAMPMPPAASDAAPAWSDAAADGDETESASRRILRDLHDAGVYSDADYAAKLAELDQA